MASICGSPVCAGGKPKLKFTYTGDYVVRKDGVVELHSSGTLVFLHPAVIDVFCVGGGGAGDGSSTRTNSTNAYKIGGGGGGGYTRTSRRISAQGSYQIVIGDGGSMGVNAGSTSFGDKLSVNGGFSGKDLPGTSSSTVSGHPGGSGGGGGVNFNSDYGTGGYDGSNGEHGYPTDRSGGTGQNFTTREFGEPSGKLYAGGGGGGRAMRSATPIISNGGSGGGGSGGFGWDDNVIAKAPAAGVANTGGGGGGGVIAYNPQVAATSGKGAPGGSGIVCFRDAVELPELAGTWVLNKRVYPPTQQIVETVSFTSLGAVTEVKQVRIGDGTNTGGGNLYIGISTSVANPSYTITYTYSTNAWANIGSLSSAQWVFPAGATASDEFRAWLASNATKQA